MVYGPCPFQSTLHVCSVIIFFYDIHIRVSLDGSGRIFAPKKFEFEVLRLIFGDEDRVYYNNKW